MIPLSIEKPHSPDGATCIDPDRHIDVHYDTRVSITSVSHYII